MLKGNSDKLFNYKICGGPIALGTGKRFGNHVLHHVHRIDLHGSPVLDRLEVVALLEHILDFFFAGIVTAQEQDCCC